MKFKNNSTICNSSGEGSTHFFQRFFAAACNLISNRKQKIQALTEERDRILAHPALQERSEVYDVPLYVSVKIARQWQLTIPTGRLWATLRTSIFARSVVPIARFLLNTAAIWQNTLN